MQCPTCNHLNSATMARCVNCGTTLIYEATGHSKEYQKAEGTLDSRMHSGIGAVFGFFLAAILLKFVFTEHWLSDHEIYIAATVAGIVGSIVGRLFLKAKQGV
jgi:hypothetical protein